MARRVLTARLSSLFLIAVLAPGCRIIDALQDGDGTATDGGGQIADADPNAPDGAQVIDATPGAFDAPPPGPDAATCSWPYSPAHFDPCSPSNPTPGPGLTLNVIGTYTYDTNSGVLTDPSAGTSSPASSLVGDVRALWVDSFSVLGSSTLRVLGSRPLMVIATGDISVTGTIDASSSMADLGAGANPSVCSASAPEPGQTCGQHGGSGGGGGAFGGNGGDGGEAGDTHDCGGANPDGAPGGLGGTALGAPPAQIRGGCSGRDGAPNSVGFGDEGKGGSGGGAVHLVAGGNLSIGGVVHTGGVGGGAGTDNRAGGGGGGSGGFVGLEALTVNVTNGAVLAANGGGGGGGTNFSPATPGADGLASNALASGGPGADTGGDGGDGGAGASPHGDAGNLSDRGGGGGGGGVGFVLVYSPNTPVISGGATISPPYIVL